MMIVVITSWCSSKDKINCLKSKKDLIPNSCWMRGLFLHIELMAEPRPSREFGIPDDIGDRHIQNNCLMPRCTGSGCKKMTIVYFSSCQWVNFDFLSFSFLLQIPYLVFGQGLRRNLQIKNYTARDIYQLWFSQGKGHGPMSCMSQSFYSLIHVMIEVCYVIVNVMIFKACENIFTSFSQRNIHRVFPTNKHSRVPVRNIASSNLQTLLDDSLVCSNIKHGSVIHWCIIVSIQALSKTFLSKRKRHTLNQLELYQELRSSHIQKVYELNRLMSECYNPGQQFEMKSFDVNQA